MALLSRWQPLHAPLVHFPMALLMLNTPLEIWHWLQPQQQLMNLPLGRVAALCVWAGLIMAMPAVLSGAFDWLRFDFSAPKVQRVLNYHLLAIFPALAAYLLTALLAPGSLWRVLSSGLACGLLIIGGHQGARLIQEFGVTLPRAESTPDLSQSKDEP